MCRIGDYKPGEIFVVKIQLPQHQDLAELLASDFLIYDKYKIINQKMAMQLDVHEIMEGKMQRYFYAEVFEDSDGTHLNIHFDEGENCPDEQDW